MRILSVSLFVWLALAPLQISAEKRPSLMTLFSEKVALSFRTVAQPGDKPLVTSGAVITSGQQSAHRVVMDQAGLAYLVYKIHWEPTPDPQRFSLSILPPDPEVVQRYEGELNPGGRRLTLPHYPPTQEIGFGDVVTLDILQDPRRSLTIVDTMSVVDPRHQLNPRTPTRPPRDFTLADVELKLSGYKIKADGLELESGGGCSGAIIWFYLPEYGRFLFSITDQPGYGFEQIGVIRDNRISFTYLGREFEWISRQPILTRGVWNLWVRPDPDYTPRFDPKPNAALIGAADSVSALLEPEHSR